MAEVIGEEGLAPGEQQAPPKADDGGTPLPHAAPSRLQHSPQTLTCTVEHWVQLSTVTKQTDRKQHGATGCRACTELKNELW